MKFKRGISLLVVFLLLVSLISPSLMYTGGAFAAQEINDPAMNLMLEDQIEWEIEVSEEGLEKGEVDFLLIASPGQEIDRIDIAEFDNNDIEVTYEANQASFKLDLNGLHTLKLQVTTRVQDLDAEEFTLEIQAQAGDVFYQSLERKENTFMKDEEEIDETDQDEEGLAEEEEDQNLDEVDEEDVEEFSPVMYLRNFAPFSGQFGDFKSLIIAPGAISNLQISTNYGDISTNTEGNTFKLFEGNISKVISFPSRTLFTPGSTLVNDSRQPVVINLDYDNVGYVDAVTDSGPELLQVGARVTVNNIKLGAAPKWVNGNLKYPRIEFSDNFFSGVFYEYIEEMQLDIEFYLSDNPDTVLTFDRENGYMTFLSLNGYNYVPGDWSLSNLIDPSSLPRSDYHEITFEYVASVDGVEGILSKQAELSDGTTTTGSRIIHNPNGTTLLRGGRNVAADAYYMEMDAVKYPAKQVGSGWDINEWYKFEDKLGGKDFQDSGVTFPLSGTVNKFRIGSTYGYTWNSFSGVSVGTVQHDPPTKTIQPISSSGDIPGYGMRYYNDLDRFHIHKNSVNHDDEKGEGDEIDFLWELSKYYWVDGHNPDDLEEDEILGRYVKTGEEFYYFINQKAISIQTDSLILPNKIIFEDFLPEGISLANNHISDLTLYNIDGSVLELSSSEWSYDSQTRRLTVTLSKEATNKINQLTREREEGDITLRIKSKVTDSAVNNYINENSYTNKAKTIFYYRGEQYTAESNRVQTAIRKLDVEKNWDDNDNEKGLRPNEVTIGLRKKTGDQCSGENLAVLTLNEENNWKGSFGSNIVGSGDYCVIEIDPDENYEVVIGELEGAEEDSCYKFAFQVENILLTKDVVLYKIAGSDEDFKLKGAVFQLVDEDTGDVLDEVTSDDNGEVKFEELTIGKYLVKEVGAPDGFAQIQQVYKFEIVKDDNGQLVIQYKEGWDGQINNIAKDFDLELVKEDEEGNKLEGAEFTLFDDKDKVLSVVESDDDGKVVFTGLSAGSYLLKETSGILGYELSDLEIEFTIDEKGQVEIINPIDLKFSVELKGGEENNKLIITSPIVNNKIKYQLKVLKVNQENHEITLEGAVFELYDEEKKLVDTLKTGKDGILIFENLSLGKYQLKEIKAPDGFKLPTKVIEVEITGQDEIVKLLIENKSYSRDLPMTGGTGLLVFALVGVLLMITAGSLYPKIKKG